MPGQARKGSGQVTLPVVNNTAVVARPGIDIVAAGVPKDMDFGA